MRRSADVETVRKAWAAVRRALPRGGSLPTDLWEARHRTVLVILWLHVAAVPVFAAVVGQPVRHVLVDTLPVALLAASASLRRGSGQQVRSMLAAIGLLTASAVLVHAANGSTEMHFHFFVMVALIALYQDWMPLLAAFGFVLLHHAVFGVIAPEAVYGHGEAIDNPFSWALIHGVFVLAAGVAQITTWRMAETQHDRSEAALRSSERRFRSLIEHSSDGVSVIGADRLVRYDSPSVAREFGLGTRVGKAGVDGVHPDDVERLRTVIAALDPGGSAVVEHRIVGTRGTRWVESQVTNLVDVPEVEGVVVNFRDVSERRELELRLAHQAFHDALTNLPNRALFTDRIDHALRTGRRAAVLFIDLDDFKLVNDALGHVTGDEVLVEAARRIAASLRPGDTCARLGGDEFGVLLEDVGDEAYDVGDRLLDVLQAEVATSEGPVTLDASIGLAFGLADDGADDLIRNADLAMYKAKGRGKGRLEIFEDGMREAVLERLALKVDMSRALEAGEFVPRYQPVVSLATGRLVGAEALVRWEHPERGVLAPASFIELAEASGIIVGIGREILRRACADAASWTQPIGISVNLSARQLQQDSLVADVAETLEVTGLQPSRLTLEITESVLVAEPEAASRVLAELKDLGVSIALDDFGTGYSSLSYLNRFPVDGLKIDKSFIDALDSGQGNDVVLLQAIIGLGRTLELTIVAEGIERHEQRAALQALGCGMGQGYLFARPLPEPEFRAWATSVLASS